MLQTATDNPGLRASRHGRGSRSDIYPTGAMDRYIRLALDRAALVREIYRRVANVQHSDTWHPLGVICPTCGKVGTTIVSSGAPRSSVMKWR